MDLNALLQKLTAPACVSGSESAIAETAAELLRPFCDTVEIVSGNVCGTLGIRQAGKPHVLLDAHLDQVGFVVTEITPDGFVRVGNVGGLEYRFMPAQRVLLHGRQNIAGVICCIPPHLQSGKKEHVAEVTELAIDTGYSREHLEQLLSVGDSVTFDMPFRTMAGGYVTSPSLDDRCGMAAILCAMEELQGQALPCSLSVLFSTQEELGERGAKIGAYTIAPDIALAVDVTFGDAGEKVGVCGKGPLIGISPSLSRDVSDALIAAADAAQIPWQPEVMAGTTGTNADRFAVTRGGVRAGTVSIPLCHMHTPVEKIRTEDVALTGKLLAAYVRGCASC